MQPGSSALGVGRKHCRNGITSPVVRPDTRKTRTMLLATAFVLGILWLLGLVGVYDLGVRTHVLLLYSVLCLLLAIFEAFRARDAGKARAHGSPSNE